MTQRSRHRQLVVIALLVGGVIANLSAISLWGKHTERRILSQQTHVLSATDENSYEATLLFDASGVFADIVLCATDPSFCPQGYDPQVFSEVDFSDPEEARMMIRNIVFEALQSRR